MTTWLEHVAKWRDCDKCPLAAQRDNIVIARGTVPCAVLFVGEAPGASEDAIGLPFKGPAGGLLDQIIERAVPPGVTYAMTNLVCCFPREAKAVGDNEPTSEEIAACRPRLKEFVEIAAPKLVVTVGTLATAYFPHHLRGDDPYEFCSIDHPAYILRMPLAQKGMAVQRTIVVLRTAVQQYVVKLN